MTNPVFHLVSGIFMIAVAIGFSLSQIGITKFFHYPKILRQPTATVLQTYYTKRKKIQPYWMIFSLCSLMLIALSAIFYKLLDCAATPYLLIGTFFGIAAAVFYVIGLMRWVFLADSLSAKYMASGISEEKKEMLVTVFESFHLYCGNSLGETMGFLCMGIWIALTGAAITASSLLPWQLGCGYIVCGVGIGLAPFEWVGLKAANKINKIAMKLFMLCLVITGIILIIR